MGMVYSFALPPMTKGPGHSNTDTKGPSVNTQLDAIQKLVSKMPASEIPSFALVFKLVMSQKLRRNWRDCPLLPMSKNVLKIFARLLKVNLKSWPEYERAMRKDVLPFVGQIELEALDTPTIWAVIRRIAERGRMFLANRIFQYVSKMFNCWLVLAISR